MKADRLAIRAFRQAEPGLHERFLALQQPRPVLSLALIGLAWVGLLGSWAALVYGSLYLLPVLLFVTASLQRLLGNSLHDTAHGNIFNRDREWLSEWLLAAPLFEDLERYRKLHARHHAWLHKPDKDPDYLPIPWKVEDGEAGPSAGQVYLRTLLDWKRWRGDLLGELLNVSWRTRLRFALWWGSMLLALGTLGGPAPALAFVGLWFASRATTFHALKVFTELADHSGLRVGSILSYTRNAPRNLLSVLIHPVNDNYHLTHHLAPKVPMLNLHAVHQLLWGMEQYREGHQCDGYFSGKYSVVKSWIRRCPAKAGRRAGSAAAR